MIARAALWCARRVSSFALVLYALGALLAAYVSAPAATGNAVERGLARSGVWGLACALLLPVLVVRAAALQPGWRTHQVDWLAAAPVGRGRWLTGAWCGLAALAATTVLACAALGELRARSAGPGWVLAGELDVPRIALLASDRPERWWSHAHHLLDHAPRGTRARIHLALAGGGPAAEVCFRVLRGPVQACGRIAGRQWLEAEIEPGSGDLELELERIGEGAAVVLAQDKVQVLMPIASERWAAVGLGTRALAFAIAACALALGFSSWVSGPTAALLALAPWIASWLAIAPPNWMPAADWFAALDLAGEGVAPAAPALASIAMTALACAAGLGLGSAARWSQGA